MKAYFWGNIYLSSIQQGIQAGHVIADMAGQAKLDEITDTVSTVVRSDMFWEWVNDHKTMILYRGGNMAQLTMMAEIFGRTNYPTATFHEDAESLNGALTSIGIVLPDRFHRLAAHARSESIPYKKLLSGYNKDEYLYRVNDDDGTDLTTARFDADDQHIVSMLVKSSLAS